MAFSERGTLQGTRSSQSVALLLVWEYPLESNCSELKLFVLWEVTVDVSHNPPDPIMLDIYDNVGVVVMDENRLFDNNTKYVENMGALVKRDRNHPRLRFGVSAIG